MSLGKKVYFPLIRTREAELKAIESLSISAHERALLAFELTRSRRSKNNANGDIDKNIGKIIDLVGDEPFALDLTVETEYSNPQIEELLNPRNGFESWTSFVKDLEIENLIPMIHIAEGMSNADLKKEVENLSSLTDYLSIRLDYSDKNNGVILAQINEVLGDLERLYIYLDAGFIRTRTEYDHDDLMLETIDALQAINIPKAIIPMSSSFPSSVKDKGYGGDEYGKFPLSEVILTRILKEARETLPIYHGDYCLIHPHRYPDRFGGWIPRIDVPLDDECFYYRYRREDGGYIEAAKSVLNDNDYENIGAWGDEQIITAADGKPDGRSPSHWIAVRMNIHITRQAMNW